MQSNGIREESGHLQAPYPARRRADSGRLTFTTDIAAAAGVAVPTQRQGRRNAPVRDGARHHRRPAAATVPTTNR